MKNFIKPFRSFVNENRESGNYPPGTEFDPNAPWNQKDPDIYRENDWIDSAGATKRIKFDLLSTDYNEFAILKSLENGELYVVYLSSEEIEEYMPKYAEKAGYDEDGDIEYEYIDADMDSEAIIALASDYADTDKAGDGLSDWDSGSIICKIDAELADSLINDFQKWASKNKKYASMIEAIRSGMSMNEAELRDSNIKVKLDRIYELKNRIKELIEETTTINVELREFDTDIKPVFDSMKVLNDRIATTEKYVIKITRFGGPADNPSYAKAIEQALEKVDDATKAIINECVRVNTGVKNNTHQYDIEKVDESLSGEVKRLIKKVRSKVISLVDRFKEAFGRKLEKIDAANATLEKLASSSNKSPADSAISPTNPLISRYFRQRDSTSAQSSTTNEAWNSFLRGPKTDDASHDSYRSRGFSQSGTDDLQGTNPQNYVMFNGRKFYNDDLLFASHGDTGEIPRIEGDNLIIANPTWSD